MGLRWKKNEDGIPEARTSKRTFQILKSGEVWELIEVIGDKHCYLTNAKSLLQAKRIATAYKAGQIYFDEECVPRKVKNESRLSREG